MSDWTNLEEIMQDLSVAQGYVVPAALETFAANRPPAFNIEEEDSEERSYYESEGGGGNFPTPDYELIQQMLHMVKEKKDDPVLSSDLDPNIEEFVPQHIQKKLKRNVALSSIIRTKEAALSARRPIPNDVIPTMFKKKSLKHLEDGSKKVVPSQISSPEKYKQYTPSTHASAYYTKYLERSKLKEEFEEDVWARAQRQMNEIEARRKLKAELVSLSDRSNMSPPVATSAVFDVTLPEHRHLLPVDCIVCIVAAKHSYYF